MLSGLPENKLLNYSIRVTKLCLLNSFAKDFLSPAVFHGITEGKNCLEHLPHPPSL